MTMAENCWRKNSFVQSAFTGNEGIHTKLHYFRLDILVSAVVLHALMFASIDDFFVVWNFAAMEQRMEGFNVHFRVASVISMFVSSREKLFAVSEVPEHFRESFILSGYRSPRSSFSQCVLSVFQLTNETLNIWTHLIATVVFGWNIVAFCQNLEETSFPCMMPLFIYMATMFGVPFASTLAHIFNTMSDRARHVCFYVDYWVLSLFGFSSANAFHAYSFTESQKTSFYANVYLPGAALMCCGCFLISCHTRNMNVGRRRKVIRFLSFGLPYFYYVLPLLFRLLADPSSRDADYFHWQQFIFGFLSAFLYCSHIPERLFPGKFDFIGHSHQLFHVAAVVGSHYELLALMKDSAVKQPPSSVSCSTYLLLMILVFAVNSITVLYYVNYVDCSYRPPNANCASGLVNQARDSRDRDSHSD